MPAYLNLHGASGVTSYEIGPDFISVTFRSGQAYRYTHAITGRVEVEHMKRLAVAGRGLSTFISRNRDNLPYE